MEAHGSSCLHFAHAEGTERVWALALGATEPPLLLREKACLHLLGRRKGPSGQSVLPAGPCPGCPVRPDSGE